MAKPRYGYYALGYYLAVFLVTLVIGLTLWGLGVSLQAGWAVIAGAIVLAYGALQPFGYWLGVYVLPENRVRRAERVAESLSLETVERVVDVGAGRGVLSIAFAKRLTRGRVIAVDIWAADSRERLGAYDRTAPVYDHSGARTRRNAEIEGVADRIDFLTADATRLALADASAEVVTAGYLLFHLHEGKLRRSDARRLAALREFHRVLKPGGTFVAFELVHQGWANVLAWTPLGYLGSVLLTQRLTAAYWTGLLETAGFRVEACHTFRGNVILRGRKDAGSR